MKKNPALATKMRKLGLSKIVDSERVRTLLSLPIHSRQDAGITNVPQWKKIDELHLNFDPRDAKTTNELIDLLLKHQKYSEALVLAKQANVENPQNIEILFRVGACYLELDLGEYLKICRLISSLPAGSIDKYDAALGVGQYFQVHGEWDKAHKAYGLQFDSMLGFSLIEKNSNAIKLCARTALAAERAYEFDSAIRYYELLRSIDPNTNSHEKHALCHEKMGRWERASEIYLGYLSKTEDPTIIQRVKKKLSYSYFHLGDFRSAVEAVFGDQASIDDQLRDIAETCISELTLNSISKKTSLFWRENAKIQLARRDWTTAISSLQNALDRSYSHDEGLYDLYALAQACTHNLQKSAELLSQSVLFASAYGITLTKYKDQSLLTQATKYAEYRKHHELNRKTVLFESYHGQNMSCHPLAIYKEMSSRPEFSDFTFVWAVKPNIDFSDNEKISKENVVYTTIGSDAYNYHLATAGYLVNNVTFPTYFTTRDGQKYLNTWHGIPLKHLGKDVEHGTIAHANVARNILQATHLISPNRWYSEEFVKINDVDLLFAGKNAVIGSPRFDNTFNISRDKSRCATIKEGLGLDPQKPVVLYAPTWRGLHGNADSDLSIVRHALTCLVSNPEIQVIFKPHQFLENDPNLLFENVVVPPTSVDTSELLAIADVLISDYSSIIFDYLPLNRPTLFHIPDYVEYTTYRGLYFTSEELPGLVSFTDEELISNLLIAVTGATTQNQQSHPAFETELSTDGFASQRAVDYFFCDSDQYVVQTSSHTDITAIFNGMYPNGITSSLYNLLQSLRPLNNVVLVTDGYGLKDNPGRVEQVRKLSQLAPVVGRVGISAFTAEERWIYQTFLNNNRFFSKQTETALQEAMQLEFRRIFGRAPINKIIDFEGMSPFWSALIGAQRQAQKAIWQHSDIVSEMKARFSNLIGVFQQYSKFDKVVSISPSITELNKQNLHVDYNISPANFVTVPNQISLPDPTVNYLDFIPADTRSAVKDDHFKFLFVGRLSIEKNLELLIRSFATVAKQHKAQLIIVGEGTSKQGLIKLVNSLNLESKVLFTGQITNPSWFYSTCDAFVMSSSHEGMPMVILEALIYDKPVISTDLPGVRDTLEPLNGHLCTHTESDLAHKMLSVAQGNNSQVSFDAEEYSQGAVNAYTNLFS